MDATIAIAGLFFVAFITPGPNNLIVMSTAARSGFHAVLPICGGIILGSVVMFVLGWLGVSQMLTEAPVVQNTLLAIGCGYLAWLGLSLVLRVRVDEMGQASTMASPTFVGLALFQFVNPKSWVLVMTAVVATSDRLSDVAWIIAVMALTSASCLAVWAFAGSTLSRVLAKAKHVRVFNGIMGLLLVACAGSLAASAWL